MESPSPTTHPSSRVWIAYLRAQERSEVLDRANEVLQAENETLKQKNRSVRWQLQTLAEIREEAERGEAAVAAIVGRLEDGKARPCGGRGWSGGSGCGSVRKALRVAFSKVSMESERLAVQIGELDGRVMGFDVKLTCKSWKAEKKVREKEFEHWMGDCWRQ